MWDSWTKRTIKRKDIYQKDMVEFEEFTYSKHELLPLQRDKLMFLKNNDSKWIMLQNVRSFHENDYGF